MFSFVAKIIIFPITLLLSRYLFTDIYYPYFYQSIFVGVILAAMIHLIELVLLRPGFLLITTLAEFLTAFAVVHFTQFLLPGAFINLIGVSVASTLITIIQYFISRYLLVNNSIKKFD